MKLSNAQAGALASRLAREVVSTNKKNRDAFEKSQEWAKREAFLKKNDPLAKLIQDSEKHVEALRKVDDKIKEFYAENVTNYNSHTDGFSATKSEYVLKEYLKEVQAAENPYPGYRQTSEIENEIYESIIIATIDGTADVEALLEKLRIQLTSKK